MAPSKKGGPAKAASPPLQACIIALSGTFPGRTQPSTEKDLITPLGGTLAKSITVDTTHLVTTEGDYAKPSTKVAQAKSKNIHIVNMTWLEDCLDQNARMDEAKYSFGGSNSTAPSAAPPAVNSQTNGKAKGKATKKRAAAIVDDEDEEEDKPQPKKVTKPAGAIASDEEDSQGSKPAPRKIDESKLNYAALEGKTNVATLSYLKIPVDEYCGLTSYQVYIDDDKVIYDASLNQTNAGNNNNKFYRVQVCIVTQSLAASNLNSFYTTMVTSRRGLVGAELVTEVKVKCWVMVL